MKYNYYVEIIDINGHDSFIFRLPKELKVVEIFLNSDIQSEYIANVILDYCKNVQNGISEEEIINGNSCRISIKPDYVQIQDRYAEDNDIVTIETSELMLLIDAFVLEKKKFIASNSAKK
ncbi:hypothetical protein [Acetivibrio clariflavus]|uniref:Uncharacterized protein n=1 Tax=Acetivibrio clariflavus (strain DSM 19732 / NBRC 101661 / EBR45) TaxID=720554 RepID=G8M2X8_ACECE|nr:hypothetical protein [Acetivibrio clariflavus]AEV68242.1 hypothetical protein Clocl_1610 [Acetivibrio clariflavus DSM 19732]